MADTINWKLAEQQLEKVTKYLSTFEGKAGHNPFMYYNQHIKPLADRYLKGERTIELYKEMIELKEIAPNVNKLNIPNISHVVIKTKK